MTDNDTRVEDVSDGTPSQSIIDEVDTLPTSTSTEAPTTPNGTAFSSDPDDEVTQEIPAESFMETGERVIAEGREREQRIAEMLVATSMRPTVNIRPLSKRLTGV
jgi:hypothetical protein